MGLLVGKVAFHLLAFPIHLAFFLSYASSLLCDSIPLTSQLSVFDSLGISFLALPTLLLL
jgi:hypothetical protein